MSTVVYKFTNCSYIVGTGDAKKTLISNVSGYAESGKLLAIMGPSGAGKTVLLKMLTLEKGPGVPSGTITLNGKKFTQALYQKTCSFVTQNDLHATFLTAREHVEYAVKLYQHNLTLDQRKKVVDDLIVNMGLLSCQHTRAGNDIVRGLSGGQKRRLSLAIALAKKPSVVFLDEPTSGLDAAAATSIIKFLKSTAASTHVAIICTIHQPSQKIFNEFDNTLILSSGRTAYFGKADDMESYLMASGHAVPSNSNAPEHMLDLINKDFTSETEVDSVISKFSYVDMSPTTVSQPLKMHITASVFYQTYSLLQKQLRVTYKDPTMYVGRMIAFFIMCTFFSIVYIQARSLEQEQIQNRMFVIMWYVGVPSMLGVIVTYTLNIDFHGIRRDVRDGMYTPFSYVASQTIIQIPMMFIFSLFALGVPAYAIGNFYGGNFIQFVLIFSVMLWAFECIAQLCSLFSNPLIGMFVYVSIWFSSFLFSGMFLPKSNVIWPFRTLTYMFPIAWANPSLVYYELKDYTSIDGAVTCTQAEFDAGTFGCTGDEPGYRCQNLHVQQCYGVTGPDALVSLSQNFESIEPIDVVDPIRDTLINVAIAILFKFTYFLWLRRLVNKSATPNVPAKIDSIQNV